MTMGLLGELIEPNNLRLYFSGGWFGHDVLQSVREDASFLALVRRAFLPTPFDREPELPRDVFPPFAPFRARGLEGKRIALVLSGGSGALASAVGVQRAFEEAGLEPCAISACSGSLLFSSLWAAGLRSEQVADFWMSLRMRDYVDPDLPGLARALVRGFSRWAGLLRGDAIERTFRARIGDRPMRDTKPPLYAVAWDVDRNRVRYLSPTDTPELPIARAARIAISIPIFVEPVALDGHLFGDGGVVSVFPARPIADLSPPADVVFGLNCYLPRDFAGEDKTGWRDRTIGVLRASEQLRTCVYLELAREEQRLLGAKLRLLHPVSYEEVRGAKFYENFLDRRRWPEYMRRGRDMMRRALMEASDETMVARRLLRHPS